MGLAAWPTGHGMEWNIENIVSACIIGVQDAVVHAAFLAWRGMA